MSSHKCHSEHPPICPFVIYVRVFLGGWFLKCFAHPEPPSLTGRSDPLSEGLCAIATSTYYESSSKLSPKENQSKEQEFEFNNYMLEITKLNQNFPLTMSLKLSLKMSKT